jgi:hypothetical protein
MWRANWNADLFSGIWKTSFLNFGKYWDISFTVSEDILWVVVTAPNPFHSLLLLALAEHFELFSG